MTIYRNFKIQKEKGARDIWFNVILNGNIIYRAATENDAMMWINRRLDTSAESR